MADVPVSSLGEDEARREEWRAAHLLLSAPVPAPVPENLTRLLRGKTAPRLPSTPTPLNLFTKRARLHGLNTSSLVRLLLSGSWRTTTRNGAFKFIESVSLGVIESLPTDPTRVRRSVHKSQENRLSTPSGRWLGGPAHRPRQPRTSPRRSPRFAKKGRYTQSIDIAKLARAMTTAEIFTNLG